VAGARTLVKRIEGYTTAPALVLSFAILCTLIVPLVVQLPPDREHLIDRIGWGAWLLFTVEYLVRLYVAHDRRAFVRENLTDLVVVLVALPTPLVARDDTALSILRTVRVLVMAFEIGKDISHLCKTRNVPYALAIVILAVITCGILGFHFEARAKGANILDLGDGVWWALTTITTVGYGDKYPITLPGRLVAIALMVVGIAFTGIISAALVSIFLRRSAAELEEDERRFQERVQRAVQAELAPVKELLAKLLDASGRAG
jgi:voltage-gated potassium channel